MKMPLSTNLAKRRGLVPSGWFGVCAGSDVAFLEDRVYIDRPAVSGADPGGRPAA
jgi:hypothetical protein